MSNFFFKYFLIFFFLSLSAFADKFQDVAINFLKFKGVNKTIISSETLNKDSEIIAHIYYLSNGGYIIVPDSEYASPIKAYSFISKKVPIPFKNILKKQLASYKNFRATSSLNHSDNRIQDRWEFLKNYKPTHHSLKTYNPDTFLLTTTWDQNYPYNKFFPKLQDKQTLTGCVQTAMAQIMKYWNYPAYGQGHKVYSVNIKDESGNFSGHNVTLETVYSRPYNWEIMPDNFNTDFNQTQADEVGYLMRDLAILNEASLGIEETEASNNNYGLYKYLGYSKDYNSTSSADVNFSVIFNIIKQQIDLEQPLFLNLPGHMVVADGYSSDSSGKFVHLNMGWGGNSNAFYNIDEDILDFEQAKNNDISISFNIKPCSESAGDCYVNLENNETILNYDPNTSLEINDTFILDDLKFSLEDSDLLSGNNIKGELNTSTNDLIDYYFVILSGDTNLTRNNIYYNFGIYDLNGSLIADSLDENISVPGLESGMYIIKVSKYNNAGSGYDWENLGYNFSFTTQTSKPFNFRIHSVHGLIENSEDIDIFEVYLSGKTSLFRLNKYYNIALYDLNGSLITESLTDSLGVDLIPNKYIIKLSKYSSEKTYYEDNSYFYDFALITEDLNDTKISEINSKIHRFEIKGNLNSLMDEDEFILYLEGNATILRDQSGYDLSLFDMNRTLIKDVGYNSDNLVLKDLPAGKYILKVSFWSGNHYLVFDKYNMDYNLIVSTDRDFNNTFKSDIDNKFDLPPQLGLPGFKLNKIVLSKPKDILLYAYDLNGDEVNISVYTNPDIVQAYLNKNILTLVPQQFGVATQMIVDLNGVEKNITIIITEDEIAIEGHEIIGQFEENVSTVFSHKVILEGNCSISSSGFRQVLDSSDANITTWEDSTTILTDLPYDIYEIDISLQNQETGSYYSYDENHSAYIISINCQRSNEENINSMLNLLEINNIVPVDYNSNNDDLSDDDNSTTDDLSDDNNSTIENNTTTEINTTFIIDLNLSLNIGWNLIANPTNLEINLTNLNPDIKYVFGYKNGEWSLWENGNYSLAPFKRFEFLKPKNGYWFNMANASMLSFHGENSTCPDFSILTSGWHFLGSCEANVSSVFDANPNILIIYTFENNHWNAVGSSDALNSLIEDNNIPLINSLRAEQGFWVYIP